MIGIIRMYLVIGIILSVCSQLTAQQTTYTFREINNLAYLSPEETIVDSLQRLNLLIPNEVTNPPLLLWIGGGAWSFVDRHQEMALARKFAERGIAVASVGHQLSKGAFVKTDRTSGVQHPSHVEDVAAAFKWLYDQATTYGYDPHNLFVGGFSSGAHLAALLGMDARYLQKHNLATTAIRGILPVAGTYDIVDYYQAFVNSDNPQHQSMAETHVKDVFGDSKEGFIKASPTTYLDQMELPMLLISEGALYDYTRYFEDQLRTADYQNYQVFHLFNFDHGGLWKDLSFAEHSIARNVMVDFIRLRAK